MIKRCKDCVNYEVIGQGVKGGEKARCKYCESMIHTYTKACKRHYKERK